ncbi:MAG TPA: tetratricopeptide repeat protein [Fimbriimonadaceae bacterium]|jgi:hypothetical protein
MRVGKRSGLIGWICGLFVAQFLIHGFFISDQWVKNFAPAVKNHKGVITGGLSPDQLMLELFGFREFLAGILWVRADSFFDQGNYDAVLPIIRLCTILDPKDIDVYATGMWHIAYNFTDDDQRSDRRYIAPALALGQEGANANPETYELYFETGWIWYHKIDDDYDHAVKWFEEANSKDDIQPARRNLLAHAYERNDQPDKELETLYKNIGISETDAKKTTGSMSYGDKATVDTDNDNIDNTIIRMTQRGWFAEKDGTYAQGDYDTKPPFDVGFSARVTVESEKVVRIEGTWNVLPVGTRIRLVLRDATIYDPSGKERIDQPAQMKWDYASGVNLDPSKEVTFMQDQGFVKNRRFDKRIDMSKDPTMYPFDANQKVYYVEFFYDPRSAPSHIQDKFGWNGEGMTDKNYLNTDVRPGQRCLYCKLELTRDQILRRHEWQDQIPVVQTPNFNDKAASGADDRVITLGGTLRGQTK